MGSVISYFEFDKFEEYNKFKNNEIYAFDSIEIFNIDSCDSYYSCDYKDTILFSKNEFVTSKI